MPTPLRITLPTNDEIRSRLLGVYSNNAAVVRLVYTQVALHGGQLRTPVQIVGILRAAAMSYIHSAQCARMASAVASIDALMDQFIDAMIPDKESADAVKAYWEQSK